MDPRSQEDPSKELERLAEEQISDLSAEGEDRVKRDKRRRERVVALYAAGAIQTPEDHYHAALVLLYGDDVGHFDLSRKLAQHAARENEPHAWSVIAAAWDRALIARGKPQRFGTQFLREHGQWSLGEVDPRVSDAERAFYGVPPLWVQRQHLEQIRQRDEDPEE